MASLILLLLPLFVCSFLFVFRHLKLRRQFSSVPSPRSYPFIGHMLITKPDIEETIGQIMAMAYLYPSHPRMTAFWIGPTPTIMIYSATLLESITGNTDHLNKGFSYEFLRPWLGNGLLTSCAEQWRPRRKLLTPTFHYDILKLFLHIFNHQSSILVQKLHKISQENKGLVADVSPLVSLCALDIICETSMGQSVNAQFESDSEYVRAVLRINDIIQRRQCNPLMWLDTLFNWFGDGKEHSWALEVLHSFTHKVIVERREMRKMNGNGTRTERLAFLDLLLAMEQDVELTEQDIQNEVDTFMFEGHDTTSAAVVWALFMLGNHPAIQQRAFDEIQSVCGCDPTEEVGIEQLGRLSFLECCVKEILRLYPSVPFVARRLGSDTIIGGNKIPANTQVLLNIYLIHREPEHWPNPEQFDPDRFSRENMKGRHPYAFVPFSAGSRNCIGQRFALLEEKTMLVWLLRNFRIESLLRRDQMGLKPELILRPSRLLMSESSSSDGHLLDDFADAEKIGEGTYGIVFKVRMRANGETKALKQIRLNSGNDGVPSTCIREISLLKELSHPNIVRLDDVKIHKGRRLFLVFEYIDQDLKMLLERLSPRSVPINYVKSFVWQLLQALTYCHTHRVVHRDLKPQNLLVKNDGTIKLADFGLARSFSLPSRCYTHEVVTLWYRAPEILLGAQFYSTAVDIWSLACIFAECIRNEPLFRGDSEIDQLFRIFQLLGTPNSKNWPGVERLNDFRGNFPKWTRKSLKELFKSLSEDGVDLLDQMLIYPPMDRVTAKLALAHRFFRDLNFHLDPIPTLYVAEDKV
ncbi:hypothetical protein niasHT_039212 [Heterodera trifolii]|uniref:cyclin-dependent kinase n=1 Tax=Heterodera trifolii TaxID=157864 RepID=A0ABD2I0G6_9BILA